MNKKTKLAGKFGAKYGLSIRKKIIKIEESSHKKYICPYCKRKNIRRISAGIWQCKKCSTKIAGGAYALTTSSSEIIDKIFAKK
ncbi:MAG: 50S ribosomal protein L37ae [Candidatus Aenigmarchaeota archaeon ex4484_52]|nr:MAG: 50S ribosomal protein L37ae [Candidatus Aenigmarchaeota archaeon ex4484_52]